jgi:nicotinamide mononucleotide (NMN) deamidase PncC
MMVPGTKSTIDFAVAICVGFVRAKKNRPAGRLFFADRITSKQLEQQQRQPKQQRKQPKRQPKQRQQRR